MSSASKYWQLVRIDGAGRRKVEELEIAKTFFQNHYGELASQLDISDTEVQQVLLKLLRDAEELVSQTDRDLAALCLRCFISHEIERSCIHLEMKFGTHHGFTRYDLFPLVLDDDGRLTAQKQRVSQYQSLAGRVLQSFVPKRASLTTWVMRQVRQHPELRTFLMQRGLYLVTDWAILNDTRFEQLQRILSDFYSLAQAEIEQACHLLQGYHNVYRQDRLQLQQKGVLKGKEECQPPTSEQLRRIGEYLQLKTSVTLSGEQVLHRLQTLAKQLRQYRIAIRSGHLPTESLDQSKAYALATEIQAPEPDPDFEEMQDFLTFYRNQFVSCLDQAIERVVHDRITYLQRKNVQMSQQFLTALQLFHCQGKAMGEFVSQIGLQAQYQVSRLLKLDQFRGNIEQRWLQLLRDQILDKAKLYIDANRLHQAIERIEAVLNEEVSTAMRQAKTEANAAKHHPPQNLIARRLCHHLDQHFIANN